MSSSLDELKEEHKEEQQESAVAEEPQSPDTTASRDIEPIESREAKASNRNAAIEVRNLTKYYGDFLAVDNISFEVWDGEILGFLGPNGAGKSTTIKILPASSRPPKGPSRLQGTTSLLTR